MLDVFIESLIDSLKTISVIFILYVIISFVERKISKRLTLKTKLSPVYGALIGLIPQCGFSVVSADLYQKKHITMGTLISVFIACSDEAIPLFFSNFEHILTVIPLILLKLVYAVIVGLCVDLIFKDKIKDVNNHQSDCDHEEEEHIGCCNHKIENESNEKEWFHSHILHPLIHTLKVFAFIFSINIIFGTLMYFISESVIINFFTESKYLTPVFTSLFGLIPNCASSVILTGLYFKGVIEFGALFSGLCCNAGLGLIYIFKSKKKKESIIIISILLLSSILAGYLIIILL